MSPPKHETRLAHVNILVLGVKTVTDDSTFVTENAVAIWASILTCGPDSFLSRRGFKRFPAFPALVMSPPKQETGTTDINILVLRVKTVTDEYTLVIKNAVAIWASILTCGPHRFLFRRGFKRFQAVFPALVMSPPKHETGTTDINILVLIVKTVTDESILVTENAVAIWASILTCGPLRLLSGLRAFQFLILCPWFLNHGEKRLFPLIPNGLRRRRRRHVDIFRDAAERYDRCCSVVNRNGRRYRPQHFLPLFDIAQARRFEFFILRQRRCKRRRRRRRARVAINHLVCHANRQSFSVRQTHSLSHIIRFHVVIHLVILVS